MNNACGHASATRRTILGAALLSCAASRPATAIAAPSQADLDAIMENALRLGRMPGMALAIATGGQTRVARGYGLASLPFAAPVTADTLFHLGSIGKQFTAYAILQLAEAGQVELDAPIGGYLDELPGSWRPATLRQLLNNTSGIPDYMTDALVFDRPLARSALLAAAGETLHFAPGESWAYSNTGYVLLGWLIELKSGKPYGDYLRERILAPLGMRRSRPDHPAAVIEGAAERYEDVDGAFLHTPVFDQGIASSADGGLIASANEFPLWINELRRPTLLSPAMAQNLFAPARLNSGRAYPWGMGWFVDRVHGRPLYAMAGDGPGVLARVQWSPAADALVFNCANCWSAQARRRFRSGAVAAMDLFAPGVTSRSLEPIRDRQPQRTAQAHALFTREGRIDASILAREARALHGRAIEDTIAPRFSDLRSVVPVEEFRFGGASVRRYRLLFQDDGFVDHLRIGYAPDGRICWVSGG